MDTCSPGDGPVRPIRQFLLSSGSTLQSKLDTQCEWPSWSWAEWPFQWGDSYQRNSMENKTETETRRPPWFLTSAYCTNYFLRNKMRVLSYCLLVTLNPVDDPIHPSHGPSSKLSLPPPTPFSSRLFGAIQASPDGAPSTGQESSYQFEAGWRMIDRFVIKNGCLDTAPTGIVKQRCTEYGSWSLGQFKPYPYP
jgi:hypothetical protein